MKRELSGGITSRKRFAGKSDFSAKQVSSTLLLLLLCMLMPQGVKAKEFNYPFADLAAAYSDATDNYFGNYPLTLSSTSYPSITNGFYGVSTTYGNVTVDFSKFAFRSECNGTNQGKGWYLCNSNRSVYVGCGLFVGNGTPEFAITNLKNGDVIEVSFRGAADKVVSLGFVSGNAEQNGSALANGAVLGTSTANNITTVTFTSTSKGDIIIKANGISDGTVKYTTYLTNIKITRPDVASYNYDPAKEVYDLTQVTNGDLASNNFTAADFQLNNTTAQYLTNLPGGVSTNNRIAVTGTSNWTFDDGLKNNTDWTVLNLSIANLKADDRVRITYQNGSGNYGGNQLNFGSDATNGSSALNSAAFKDNNNNGELDTDEDEHMITRDEAVDGSVFYTMTEDGHLDLIVFPGVKITKIEIYSDHQAVMLDRYNGSAATGYTAYFESTGQLMAKEHIVPGGLNVYVGNSNETQHAEVVSSDQGPVSYVYDQAHFKMARHATFGSWNVASALPATGTFYKFIPEVSGKMSVRFKAYSVHYNNIQGDGSTEGNEVATDAQCPYYLMVVPGENNNFNNNSAFSAVTNTTKGTGALVAFNNITVEAGKVYYLYGWWESSNTSCGIAQLLDVTFIADNMVTPLAKWVASGTKSDADLADVTGFTTDDLHIKKMSSNITSCEPYIEGGKLKIKNIVFAKDANPGGTILIKLGDLTNDNNPVFVYTIAYDASWNNGEGHTWDFSTNPLRGLKWNNTNSQFDVVNFGTGAGPGLLYDEMHETLNGEPHSDWTFAYRVKKGDGGLDPMYLNKYDMEGDNADMMWDTEGLIFNTGSNQSAINNEYTDNNGVIDHSNTTNRLDPDRYVGILPGGEFRIPQLMKDDRVIIYMGSGDGSGAESVFMNIENARDAVYAEIDSEDEYHIGGSLWNANSAKTTQAHGDPYYRGCYHFYATGDPDDEEKPADMVFKLLNKGTLVKLYSIEIYHGNRRGTNGVNVKDRNVDSYIFVSDKDDTQGKTNRYNLHYLGKGEYPGNCEIIAHSGSITNNVVSANGYDVSYTSNVGDFGDIRVRVKDLEMNKKYVADYADRNLTIGYKDKVDSYPYTWDFTDIKGFSSTLISNDDTEFTHGNTEIDASGRDLSLWDENGGMILREEGYNGANDQQYEIFQQNKYGSGNQLWAYDKIIPETKGLWFYFDNNDGAYNGSMKIAADGLHLANKKVLKEDNSNLTMGWWNYKMVVPDVPANAAVYLRMKRDSSVGDDDYSQKTGEGPVYFLSTKFHFGTDAKTDLTPINNGTATYPEVINSGNYSFYKVAGSTDEWILAVKNNKGAASNLTFTLNGWILEKMSVSKYSKSVNKLGYASESRNVEIDPELMGYLSGTGLKAYTVDNVTYGDKAGEVPTINLKVVPTTNVISAAKHHDHNGYIIYNTDAAVNGTKAVGALNNGFHLFVPDMHDRTDGTSKLKTALDVSGNCLRAWLPSNPTTEVMSQTYAYSEDSDGNITATGAGEGVNEYTTYVLSSKGTNTATGKTETDVERFRRVAANVIAGNNKAYLPLLTENVKPKAGASAKGMFAIVFVDEEEGTETTSLNGVESTERTYSDGYYTMDGVKVQNPTKKGIYIKNGKKIIIK